MMAYPRIERLIDDLAAARSDAPALVCGTRRWTYGELRAELDRRAGVLVAAGLQPGDHVATAERVTDDYVLAFLACARAGVVLAALSPLLAAEERAALAARLAPRLVLTADGDPDPALPQVAAFPLALPGAPPQAALDAARRRSLAGTADDPVLIRHTSGTTGERLKLVPRTHGQFSWRRNVRLWHSSEGSVHALALTTVFIPAEVCRVLFLGATLLLPQGVGAHAQEAEFAAAGATSLYTSPALLGLLARQGQPPPPGLRLAVVRTIGAGLAGELRELAERRYGAAVLEEYGTTECGAILRPSGPGTPPGSIGRPYPGVEVRLIDAAGRDVPEGAIGELVVRSPGMMLGYLDDPEATAEVLRDGWYHTGDNARRDADGYYSLVGRRGLLVNVGGNKVAPEEVEAVLERHPQVREAAVVPQPDSLRGEVVMAIIVPEGNPPGAQALRRFCRARLAGYKVPRAIEFRADPLPRSALGKLQRRRL